MSMALPRACSDSRVVDAPPTTPATGIGRARRHRVHPRRAGQEPRCGHNDIAHPVRQRARGVAAHLRTALHRHAGEDLVDAQRAGDAAVAVRGVGDGGQFRIHRAQHRQFQPTGGKVEIGFAQLRVGGRPGRLGRRLGRGGGLGRNQTALRGRGVRTRCGRAQIVGSRRRAGGVGRAARCRLDDAGRGEPGARDRARRPPCPPSPAWRRHRKASRARAIVS